MESIMGMQGDRNFMLIQEKESIMGIQEKGNSMGVQEKESIMGIQERRNIMETQEMGMQEEEGIMGILGEGSSVGPRGENSTAGIPGEESTIAGIPGANGATKTRGATPADGGPTPAGSPAVAALEVMDTLLGALAPRGPLFEKAARRALARIEGIARRDPRALLALRALLASLSRALREQIDLHARVQGLAEALGDPLAESCAAPRDMCALAGIVGSARGRGLAYQSLYDLILACDARCGALLGRWAER